MSLLRILSSFFLGADRLGWEPALYTSILSLAFWKERRIVTGEMVDCEVMISSASSVVCVGLCCRRCWRQKKCWRKNVWLSQED